jgi:hypothetical protein
MDLFFNHLQRKWTTVETDGFLYLFEPNIITKKYKNLLVKLLITKKNENVGLTS